MFFDKRPVLNNKLEKEPDWNELSSVIIHRRLIVAQLFDVISRPLPDVLGYISRGLVFRNKEDASGNC